MLESDFKKRLIVKIERLFPDCVILTNDAEFRTGIPDLTVFWRNHWALLETKRSATAAIQPNQQHYIDWANRNSFGAFVYPENEREVLRALQHAFQA